MGISVLRIAGQDYTGTGIAMANYLSNTGSSSAGIERLDNTTAYLTTETAANEWIPATVTNVVVARDDFYTDGLAGSVITGNASQPLLITENLTTVGKYLTGILRQAGTAGIDSQGADLTVSSLTILGGSPAITPATISAMESALNG